MIDKDRAIWQIAGGDTSRTYVGIFLRWDIVAMGPGAYGRWPACNHDAVTNGYTMRKLSCLERFYQDVKEGDLIVLRLGTSQVFGIGEVVGKETLWLDDFGDIDGWDLEHVRRVRWLWKSELEPAQFPTYSLKFGDTVQRMDSPEIREWINSLPLVDSDRPLASLPASCLDEKVTRPSNMHEVADLLFDEGIAAKSIDDLIAQIDDLVRIAGWYMRTNQAPSEHETVAYLVVPLLRTLGWTPQRMSVEWNFVDVALFGRTPRTVEHLTTVVEVKKMNESCLTAMSQAESYALKPGHENCRQLIVTDGLRYAVFLKDAKSGRFGVKPVAYLNLTRTRDEYPVLECEGTHAALLTMAADWNGDLAFLEKLRTKRIMTKFSSQGRKTTDAISNFAGEDG